MYCQCAYCVFQHYLIEIMFSVIYFNVLGKVIENSDGHHPIL